MTFTQRIRDRFTAPRDACQWPDFLEPLADPAALATPIADAPNRVQVRIAGRVKAVRIQPLAGVSTLQCTVADDSGELVVVFLGRRHMGGIETGRRLVVEGVIG